MACSAATAAAALVTTVPSGTGTPTSASSALVSILSDAMSAPTTEVRSVIAAQTRCL